MPALAWLFMISGWGIIIALTIYCITKIVASNKKEK